MTFGDSHEAFLPFSFLATGWISLLPTSLHLVDIYAFVYLDFGLVSMDYWNQLKSWFFIFFAFFGWTMWSQKLMSKACAFENVGAVSKIIWKTYAKSLGGFVGYTNKHFNQPVLCLKRRCSSVELLVLRWNPDAPYQCQFSITFGLWWTI